jgi:hypothetical protein
MGWFRQERRLGRRQFFQDVAFRSQSWGGDAVDELQWRKIGGVWAGWRHGFADFVRSVALLDNSLERNRADHRGETRLG